MYAQIPGYLLPLTPTVNLSRRSQRPFVIFVFFVRNFCSIRKRHFLAKAYPKILLAHLQQGFQKSLAGQHRYS